MGKVYPIYEAKAKLSAILREVKRGRRVAISERGDPIAMIVPIERGRDLVSRLADMERAGVIRPASGSPDRIDTLIRRRGALRRFLETRE